MSKSLVVCIDGTWNRPDQKDTDPVTREVSGSATNVVRIWEAATGRAFGSAYYGRLAALKDGTGEAAYFDGVGSTGSHLVKTFEGGTGTGVSERVRDAYGYLASRWEPGDRIFLFGFSRGAYAVRSLAGFLHHAGLPSERRIVEEEEVDVLFLDYRKGKIPTGVKDGFVAAPVTLLGVWDTVGALAFGKEFNDFHRISPPNVMNFAHALALDEVRKQFLPSFWNPMADGLPAGNTVVDEVWFSGVHSNVGGGYANRDLAEITLNWMMGKARALGLDVGPTAPPGSPAGEIRSSYEEFWRGMGFVGDIVAKLKLEQVHRSVLESQRVHESVGLRMAAVPGYAPAAMLMPAGTAFHQVEPSRVAAWDREPEKV
ncbi:MAG TPA: DUF2235 domain-containing protein [Azospirillaceae bacterium]|nr:DUF2235 domain-containing protein [Azospirillaceae bacterium]